MTYQSLRISPDIQWHAPDFGSPCFPDDAAIQAAAKPWRGRGLCRVPVGRLPLQLHTIGRLLASLDNRICINPHLFAAHGRGQSGTRCLLRLAALEGW